MRAATWLSLEITVILAHRRYLHHLRTRSWVTATVELVADRTV